MRRATDGDVCCKRVCVSGGKAHPKHPAQQAKRCKHIPIFFFFFSHRYAAKRIISTFYSCPLMSPFNLDGSPGGPLIQECQPPCVCSIPLWLHEPLLWFQSITHSLQRGYKCPGVPAAVPRAPSGSSLCSCFRQACQCVATVATLPASLYSCVNT